MDHLHTHIYHLYVVSCMSIMQHVHPVQLATFPAQYAHFTLTARELSAEATTPLVLEETCASWLPRCTSGGGGLRTWNYNPVCFALVAQLKGQRKFELYHNFLDKGTDLIEHCS